MNYPNQPGGPPSPYAPPGQGAFIPPTQAGTPQFPQPGGVHQQPAPGYGREFEFSPEHNAVFSSAGGWMVFMGIVSVVFGALAALGTMAVYGRLSQRLGQSDEATAILVIGGLAVVLMVVVGILTIGAGSGYRRVAHTSGSDVSNLMQAMTSLKRLYMLTGILTILYILAIVVSAVVNAGNRPA